jgi:multiple sugar transport system ATP-binding protein
MRTQIKKLHQQMKTTVVYVTHDQVEAMTMADKIVVLQAGRIEQVGSPLELYRKPDNIFVASFIGSPRMNLIEGAEAAKFGAHTIGIRPEHLTLSHEDGSFNGRVSVSEHLGSDTFLHVVTDRAGTLTVRVDGEVDVHHGDRVGLTPMAEHLHRFDAQGLAIR